MKTEDAYDFIAGALESSRMAHAYLLVGNVRGESEKLVRRLLGRLFPERPDPLTNPDIHWLAPEKASRIISVDAVHERLVTPLGMTSFSGGWKVGVIAGADRLGGEGANALLKTLEEPPPKTVFFLLTERPEQVLPTVISRAQRLDLPDARSAALGEPWRRRVIGVLTREGLDSASARAAAAGALEAILAEIREEAAERVGEEIGAQGDGESVGKDARAALVSSRYREQRTAFLVTLVDWFGDLMSIRAAGGGKVPLVNEDCRTELERRAAGMPLDRAFGNVGAVEELSRSLERNLPEGPLLSFFCDRVSFSGVRTAVAALIAAVATSAAALTFSPRMVHSGVGQGQYPDAYLDEIAKSGIDAVIVSVTDPLTGAYAGGREDLSSLVGRAAARGIGVYAYADFPVLSEKLHPDEPGAREWYDRIYGGIVKRHPGLRGMIFVGESVAFPYRDHRPTHHWWRPCRGGAESVGFLPDPDWARWLRLVKSVTRRYDPKIDLVFWTYNWFRRPERDRLALLELLPTDVSLLVTFDMGDAKTRKCGIDMTVDDYSITFPGPGSTFASEAPVAKRRGIRLYSMTNTGGRTWDFGLLPYEPVPWRWKERFEAIREARERYGLSGLMESHHYGFTPNFIFDLGTRIFADGYRPEDFGRILRELAVREAGEDCADAVLAAWRDFSDAFEWHSSYWNDQYSVLRNGPVFPFCLPGAPIPDPLHPVYEFHDGIRHGNGWKYTVLKFEFERDRLAGEEELAKRELELLDRGVARLRGLRGARRQWALGAFMAATVRTSLHAKRYYLAGLNRDLPRMLAILGDEERNVRSCFEWVDVDERIGWEPTMGRVVARDTLEWKLRQLDSARREAAAAVR